MVAMGFNDNVPSMLHQVNKEIYQQGLYSWMHVDIRIFYDESISSMKQKTLDNDGEYLAQPETHLTKINRQSIILGNDGTL